MAISSFINLYNCLILNKAFNYKILMKQKYPKPKSSIGKWHGNRIIGCQSTNHTVCEGELWECHRCHKIVCWEEGCADDLIDLCDDCWYDIQVLGQKLSIGNVSTWRLDYEAA